MTANPAIRSGSIDVSVNKLEEAWKVRATGTAQPAIPGVDSQLTVSYDDGGAFPNAGRARVLWCGLDLEEAGQEELRRMATGARAAAARSGIEVDGQRFRPHVTVARLNRPTEVSSWVRLLDGYAGPSWPVDRIDLVASYLGEGPRGRPRYETVASFPLVTDPT